MWAKSVMIFSVQSRLEEVKAGLGNKTALEGKEVAKKEEEKKVLVLEKKNIEEKRKEIEEKLARLTVKQATPESATPRGEVNQKPDSFKRKLKAPEEPIDSDPYAFDEIEDLGAKPKSVKDVKKKGLNTPQNKKGLSTPQKKKGLSTPQKKK